MSTTTNVFLPKARILLPVVRYHTPPRSLILKFQITPDLLTLKSSFSLHIAHYVQALGVHVGMISVVRLRVSDENTCLLTLSQGRGHFLFDLMSSSFETERNEGPCISNGDWALLSASKAVKASISTC